MILRSHNEESHQIRSCFLRLWDKQGTGYPVPLSPINLRSESSRELRTENIFLLTNKEKLQ